MAAGGDLKFILRHIQFRIRKKEENMLWTIFVILMILWLLGLVSGYTIGGFIHILLVIAIVVVLIHRPWSNVLSGF